VWDPTLQQGADREVLVGLAAEFTMGLPCFAFTFRAEQKCADDMLDYGTKADI
jgi:hypothetical protein